MRETARFLSEVLFAHVVFAALVTAGFAGCGTTAPDKAVAEAKKTELTEAQKAQKVVKEALTALKVRDQTKFKDSLSSRRANDFSDKWFKGWTTELERFSRWSIRGFETSADNPDKGKVMLRVYAGGGNHDIPVRVVRESGAWRWDEN